MAVMTLLLPRLLGAIAATCLVASCVSSPPSVSLSASDAILHYVRTGLDGDEAEHIYVFRPAPDRLEVYKMRQRCTNAALVTAEMDLARHEARRVTGGRLRPDGTQNAFAFLALDPVTRRLSVRAELPDQTITEDEVVGPEPLWLYDFDLADLSLAGLGREIGTAAFSLALAWPDGGDDGFLLDEGRAELSPIGVETRRGRAVAHYRVGGPAFEGDEGGDLWIDADSGALVEARLGRPNHPGYNGLSLRLEGVEAGGAVRWRELLLAHFAGCPA